MLVAWESLLKASVNNPGNGAASKELVGISQKNLATAFTRRGDLMRIASTIAVALFGGALLAAAPVAFADTARDNILRAEAQIKALNPADASAASGPDYVAAQLRLSEARIAEDKNRHEESQWRSDEASLHADIVQENIKLRALERTVSEIETGNATLRRELTS